MCIVGCGGETRDNFAPTPTPTQTAATRSALDAAHDAYLAGDWIGLGERIHDVLLDPNAVKLAKENAYELLDKAYEAQRGTLPSTFVLPKSIAGTQYWQTRCSFGNGRPLQYRFGFWMRVRAGAEVRELKVWRMPGETLLDKGTGLGKVQIKHVKDGFDDLVIERSGNTPVADGVVSLRAVIDGEPPVEGWFITHGLNATSSPEVLSPSATVTDANPVVSWSPFRSPEYATFEGRTINVWVGHMDTNGGDGAQVWNFWSGNPADLGEVRVGAQPSASIATLTPGEYWLSVTGGERRSFGPVEMLRLSQTGRSFTVLR